MFIPVSEYKKQQKHKWYSNNIMLKIMNIF
jgi:hypothetical protein